MLLQTAEKGFKVSCGKVLADHPDVLGLDIGKVRQGEDVRHVSETTYCEGVLGRKIGKYFLGEAQICWKVLQILDKVLQKNIQIVRSAKLSRKLRTEVMFTSFLETCLGENVVRKGCPRRYVRKLFDIVAKTNSRFVSL